MFVDDVFNHNLFRVHYFMLSTLANKFRFVSVDTMAIYYSVYGVYNTINATYLYSFYRLQLIVLLLSCARHNDIACYNDPLNNTSQI